MRVNFCPYTMLLIIIFSVFFGHSIFIINEDSILMATYELGDPGNIAYAIQSLFNYPIYNHHNYVILSDYGWVLGDISFIFVLLLKVFGQLMGFYNQPIFGTVDDQAIFNVAIRSVNFIFAMFSILLFFKLSNLLFNNKKVSFVASLFLMFIPWAAIYSFWLHPDASGMVFMLIALLSLVKFVKQEQKLVYFFSAFAGLELAILSKPPYLFISIPIFLIFFFNYCHKTNVKYLTFLLSSQFLKILLSSFLIAICLIFIVHPYLIIEFSVAYNIQKFLFNIYQNISTKQSFYNWYYIYKNEPLIYLNVLLLYLLIIPLFFKQRFSISFLLVTSVLFCNLFLFITLWGMKYNVTVRYLYPIAPLLILNITAFIIFAWNKLDSSLYVKNRYTLNILAGLGILYFLVVFAENVLVTVNSLLARAAYKHSTFYQVREFLLNNTSTFSQRNMLFDIGTAIIPQKMTWVTPHASVTWVPSKVINKERYHKYINPQAQIVWVPWESRGNSLKFIKHKKLEFMVLNEWRYDTYRHYLRKNHFKPIKKFQASEPSLTLLSNWFPEQSNTQLKAFKTTLKLIEVHRNPNRVIGPTLIFYGK